jgi:hypothetical protein
MLRFGSVRVLTRLSSRRKHLEPSAANEQTVSMAKKNGQSLRRAAKEVSEIMAASLSQFSPGEQDRRLKAIHKIALSAEGRHSRYRMTHEA